MTHANMLLTARFHRCASGMAVHASIDFCVHTYSCFAGRLKPYEQKAFTPQWQPKQPASTPPIVWEVTSSPAPEVSWDASDPELRAVVDRAAELLERQYPTRVQGAKFTQEDWQGSKRSKGFIQP